MRNIYLSFLMMSLCAFSGVGMAQAVVPSAAMQLHKVNEKAPLLFMQTAPEATLVKEAAQPNAYILILKEVSPIVLWFSDRPVRNTGVMQIEKFLQVWTHGKNDFAVDHPNAVLTSAALEEDTSGKVTAPVFTLSHPEYDKTTHTMRYYAVLLAGSQPPTASSLKDVALFVDSLVFVSTMA